MEDRRIGNVTYKTKSMVKNTDNVFRNPKNVLKYIIGDHFKTLAVQLLETMVEAGVCSKVDINIIYDVENEDPEKKSANEKAKTILIKECQDILYKRLVKLDKYNGRKKERNKKSTDKWFTGVSNSIRSFDDAVEICFALNLSFDQSVDFLRKTGFHIFNVRDYREAIYMYCLKVRENDETGSTDLSDKYYEMANRLICQYSDYEGKHKTEINEATGNHPIYDDSIINQDSGMSTTVVLRKEIMDATQWKNETEFFHEFLIPRSKIFTGYSNTAVIEYYRHKIYFIVYQLLRHLEEIIKYQNNSLSTELGYSEKDKQEEILASIQDDLYFQDLYKYFSEYEANGTIRKAFTIWLKEDLSNLKDFLFQMISIVSKTKDIRLIKPLAQVLTKVKNDESAILDSISSLRNLPTSNKPLITRVLSPEKTKEKKGMKINTNEQLTIDDVFLIRARIIEQFTKRAHEFDIEEFTLPCKSFKQVKVVYTLARSYLDNMCKDIADSEKENPDLVIKQKYLIMVLLARFSPRFIINLKEKNLFRTPTEDDAEDYNSGEINIFRYDGFRIIRGEEERKVYFDNSFSSYIKHHIKDFTKEEIEVFETIEKDAVEAYLRSKEIGRQLGNKEFTFSKTVMDHFPTRQEFSKFEKDPAVMYHGIATRKALILLYYVAYSYSTSIDLSSDNYQSPFGSSFGFNSFLKGLNQILDSCQMGIMYPANHFDWLILRSFFILTTQTKDIRSLDPIAFFNRILSLSHEGMDPQQ